MHACTLNMAYNNNHEYYYHSQLQGYEVMSDTDTYMYLLKQQQAIAFCDLTAKNLVLQGYCNKTKFLQVRVDYILFSNHSDYK